jgi:hypothetical protein
VAVTTTSASVAIGVGAAVWAEVGSTQTSAATGTAKRANKKASFIKGIPEQKTLTVFPDSAWVTQ